MQSISQTTWNLNIACDKQIIVHKRICISIYFVDNGLEVSEKLCEYYVMAHSDTLSLAICHLANVPNPLR